MLLPLIQHMQLWRCAEIGPAYCRPKCSGIAFRMVACLLMRPWTGAAMETPERPLFDIIGARKRIT